MSIFTRTAPAAAEYAPPKPKNGYLRVFLLCLLTGAVIFLPFIIYDGGYFLFYGDFNVQQIPFYTLAHDAVRDGNLFWNWNTDLGVNFIGSYSFYLLGSPFFWLTIPFPSEVVPYLIAPLLVLKMSVCGVTAYAFIKRFVKNTDFAVLCSMLYAFSGFSIYNVFFNHFHEPMAFFPLLLLALEEYMQNNRRGFFALAVCLNCVVNYFFFAGQVVFVLLYFFVRAGCGDFLVTLKKFFWLAFEAVLGLLGAAFLLLPSILAILGNPRTDNFLWGWNFWVYSHEQRYFNILQTFFFPPDLPARPNFFPDADAKWASIGGWLPLVGMTGVIALCKTKGKHFIKRLLIVCTVMALIPGLNSMFFLFNSAYYARWFYMPVLIMALATGMALEDAKADWESGIKWTAGITLAISLAIGLTPNKVNEKWTIGIEAYPERFWAYVAIAGLSVLIVFILFKHLREDRQFARMLTGFTMAITMIYSIFFIATGKTNSYHDQFVIQNGIRGGDKISLPEDSFYRVDVYDGMDNQAMFWQMPTIQAFHSIVPASVMEFYPKIGVERGVGSRPDQSHLGLRALTSVKYLFCEEDKDYSPMHGFTYYDSQNGFKIYENQNYLPMGFTYDYFMDEGQLNSVNETYRDRAMLRAVYLTTEQMMRNRETVQKISDDALTDFSNEAYDADVVNRKRQTCSSFRIDNHGFSADITLDKSKLVFFSVPYDEGWSATVNGEAAVVEKVNVGFMAVKCPPGTSQIRFDYETPGLKTGGMVSLAALGIFVVYLASFAVLKRRSDAQQTPLPVSLPDEQSAPSSED